MFLGLGVFFSVHCFLDVISQLWPLTPIFGRTMVFRMSENHLLSKVNGCMMWRSPENVRWPSPTGCARRSSTACGMAHTKHMCHFFQWSSASAVAIGSVTNGELSRSCSCPLGVAL